MLLLLDNYDSFTFNLVDYFARLGKECYVVRNSVDIQSIKLNQYEGLILSPGPGQPADAGIMPALIALAVGHLPILGICLGHQALALHFGGALAHGSHPVHGKVHTLHHNGHPMFQDIPAESAIVRYHSWIVSQLPPTLQPTAHSSQQELMAFAHIHLPIWGLQFHPEAACTTHGLAMLGNWLTFINKHKLAEAI